jgi:hypothetical protein
MRGGCAGCELMPFFDVVDVVPVIVVDVAAGIDDFAAEIVSEIVRLDAEPCESLLYLGMGRAPRVFLDFLPVRCDKGDDIFPASARRPPYVLQKILQRQEMGIDDR